MNGLNTLRKNQEIASVIFEVYTAFSDVLIQDKLIS
jgi:hypothetical protein